MDSLEGMLSCQTVVNPSGEGRAQHSLPGTLDLGYSGVALFLSREAESQGSIYPCQGCYGIPDPSTFAGMRMQHKVHVIIRLIARIAELCGFQLSEAPLLEVVVGELIRHPQLQISLPSLKPQPFLGETTDVMDHIANRDYANASTLVSSFTVSRAYSKLLGFVNTPQDDSLVKYGFAPLPGMLLLKIGWTITASLRSTSPPVPIYAFCVRQVLLHQFILSVEATIRTAFGAPSGPEITPASARVAVISTEATDDYIHRFIAHLGGERLSSIFIVKTGARMSRHQLFIGDKLFAGHPNLADNISSAIRGLYGPHAHIIRVGPVSLTGVEYGVVHV